MTRQGVITIGLRITAILLWGVSLAPQAAFAQQTYHDYLTHKPPPIPPPECTDPSRILSVDRAEIHGIKGDDAIVTAEGTAVDHDGRGRELRRVEGHDGTLVYDFVACPSKDRSEQRNYITTFVATVKIHGIHQIIVRAATNEQHIDVDAARRVPDPWSRSHPPAPPIRGR
jgi:hypothetical protein